VTASRSVWVDADPGLDDWLALLVLTQSAVVDVAGLSVVAGNAPLPAVLANALSIRELHQWRWPVHAGASEPMLGPRIDAQYVLGATGMRTTGAPLAAPRDGIDAIDATTAMLTWLRQPLASARSVLATGPLTNVAHALLRDRAAWQGVDEIVLMGGSTDRGNHTPAAEFNMAADPEAAAVVLGCGIPVRMVGLNVCRQVLLRQADVRQAWASAAAHRATQILLGYLDGYQRILSPDGQTPMPLYDPLAALALVQPELFEWRVAPVDVELRGEFTRGMTVVDLRNRAARPAHVQVAVGVDAAAALGAVLRAVAAVATPP
jgi:purine nucleosidase